MAFVILFNVFTFIAYIIETFFFWLIIARGTLVGNEACKWCEICVEHNFARATIQYNTIQHNEIANKNAITNNQHQTFYDSKRFNKGHVSNTRTVRPHKMPFTISFLHSSSWIIRKKVSRVYLISSNSWIKQLLFIACQVSKKTNKTQVPNNRHKTHHLYFSLHSFFFSFTCRAHSDLLRIASSSKCVIHLTLASRGCCFFCCP